jgi:hypothetical protein
LDQLAWLNDLMLCWWEDLPMSNRQIVGVIPLIVIVALAQLPGCGSHAGGSLVQQRAAPEAAVTPPQVGDLLPGPRALLAGEEQPRSASAAEEDYIRHGSDFEAALPHQHALTAISESVEFQPMWSADLGLEPDRLAYCIYKFTIPDYDRGAELRYNWIFGPADPRTVWFGLSDWQADGWHWLRGNPDRLVSFDSTAPYLSASDVIYVVVLLASDQFSVLRYLRLGEMPPIDVVLETRPRFSLLPARIVGDARFSTVPVGTIESFEWDWDGDGSFEENTGTDGQHFHVFDALGNYPYSVRVTSSYGEYATASDAFSVIESWTHSWGTPQYEELSSMVADTSSGYCYAAGSIQRPAGHRDALLLKYRLDGELMWAAAWGGEGYDALSDIRLHDGDIYTAGTTNGYGNGSNDVLAQRWSPDGEVIWSTVWGSTGEDDGRGLAVTSDVLYVVGTTAALGNTDVLLLKYSTDGDKIWQRIWGGGEADIGAAIDVSPSIMPGQDQLHITGATFSPDPLYRDILYLRFNNDANLLTVRTWRSDTANWQYGHNIRVYGLTLQDIYIAGSIGVTGEREALLLEVGSDTGSLARSWSAATETVAYGVMLRDSSLLLCGRLWSTGTRSEAFIDKFSDAGDIEFTHSWSDNNLTTGLASIDYFDMNGILVGGNCQAANLGSWAGVLGTVGEPGGTWSDYSGLLDTPEGTTAAPTSAAELISGGTVDSGGGELDTLLSVLQLP